MNNRNNLLFLFSLPLILFFLTPTLQIYAESEYVLPYPSFMPGNKLYKISKFFLEIEKYWYFGSFAQVTYNQKLSDKYLVEAKTLLEYKQYLLGYEALKKSNSYFGKIPYFIEKARVEKKDINEKKDKFQSEANRHILVLAKIQREVPERIFWKPEKGNPSYIDFHDLFQRSILLRKMQI